VARVADITK